MPEKVKKLRKRSRNDKAYLFEIHWNLLAKTILGRNPPKLRPEFPIGPYFADYKLARYKIVVEVDGGQFQAHGGAHNSDSHRNRHNTMTAAGWKVFHFSPQQISNDPWNCVRIVLSAIDKRLATLV